MLSQLLTLLGVAVTTIGISVNWLSPRSLLRRRLLYQVQHSTRVVTAEFGNSDDIRVVYKNDRTLNDPYIIELAVRNSGAFDIARDQFDGGNPIEFDLEAEIIEILNVRSNISGKREPKFRAEKNSFLLLPDLLPRKMEVVFTILTDGEPHTGSPQHQLIHTGVVDGERINHAASMAMRSGVFAYVGSFFAFVFLVFIYHMFSADPHIVWYDPETWPDNERLPTPVDIIGWAILSIGVIGGIVTATLEVTRRRFRKK